MEEKGSADAAQARLLQHLLAADAAVSFDSADHARPGGEGLGDVGIKSLRRPTSRQHSLSRSKQERAQSTISKGISPMVSQDSAFAEHPEGHEYSEGGSRYGPGLPWPGGGGASATEEWGFKNLGLGPPSSSQSAANSLFPLPPGTLDRHRLQSKDRMSVSQGSARLRVPGQSAGRNHNDSGSTEMLIFSSGSSIVSGENTSSRSRDGRAGSAVVRPESRASNFVSEFGGRSGLIESRNARVRTEHHYQLLKARVAKLAFEEERANKTALVCKTRAQDVLRLRADVERRRRQQQERREKEQDKNTSDAKKLSEFEAERRAVRRALSQGYA
jgi:hypothetical protein